MSGDPRESVVEPRELDAKIVRSSGWVAISFGGSQLMTFLSLLVLIRLLEPEAFGLVALASTILVVLERLQQSGTGAAVVYWRKEVESAAASALLFAAATGVVLYGALFASAPLLARAFDAPALTEVVQVLSALILFRAASVVPGAILERGLDFRSRAKAELGSGIAQVGVSIGLAVAGFGVWSLVAGQLSGAAIRASVLWLLVPWRPSPRQASWSVLKGMLRYGRFIGAANVVNLVNNTIDNLVVGRLLGVTQLGFYAVSYRLATFPRFVIGQVVGRVMFPVYSLLQDDLAAQRRAYVQNLQRVALLALPVSVGLFVATEPIVLGLMGPAWREVITPLRILALYGLIKSLTSPCGELWKGVGKPHYNLVLQVSHALLIVPTVILLTPRFGLAGAATAMTIVDYVTGLPAVFVTMRLLRLEARELARALAAPVLCSAGLAVVLSLLLPMSDALSAGVALVMLVAVGVLVYAASTLVFARSVLAPIWLGFRGTSARGRLNESLR